MPAEVLAAFAVAVAWAVIHVEARRLGFLDALPRSRVLSAAGGVSVSYVFLHLLPEITAAHRVLAARDVFLAESAVFLLALAGLVTFYGLESAVRPERRPQQRRHGAASLYLFRVHLGAFAIYNALLAYLLLHRDAEGPTDLALYGVAIGLHLVVNDQALRDHHRARYRARGRWILAGAILVGWAVGAAWTAPEAWSAGVLAFVGGAVILNVLKEELPSERESRWWAFVLGAAGYGALLLVPRI